MKFYCTFSDCLHSSKSHGHVISENPYVVGVYCSSIISQPVYSSVTHTPSAIFDTPLLIKRNSMALNLIITFQVMQLLVFVDAFILANLACDLCAAYQFQVCEIFFLIYFQGYHRPNHYIATQGKFISALMSFFSYLPILYYCVPTSPSLGYFHTAIASFIAVLVTNTYPLFYQQKFWYVMVQLEVNVEIIRIIVFICSLLN